MKYLRKKPKRSLRTILVLWFLFFSIAPLAFVTVYSMKKFEKAIDNELSQRLNSYARDIQTVLADYRSGMIQKREKYSKDESLMYYLSTGDSRSLKELARVYLQSDFSSHFSFFDQSGQLIFSLFKDQKSRIQEFFPVNERILLSDKYMTHLEANTEIGLAELKDKKKISLKLYSKFKSSSGRTIGFFEQVIDLDRVFIERLKSRFKLELLFFKDSGDVALSSHSEFYRNKNDFLKTTLVSSPEQFFEINLGTEPFGFLIRPIQWESTQFFTAIGVSKKESKDVIRKINVAFLGVVGMAGVILFITILISSSYVLKPLNDLVEALQSFESQEQAITIPVKNDTEIGLLTESFNQMFKKIWQARADLKKKVFELQSTNKELKET
ncbi:MAG: HAMP domain-containing protein, partial [Pseudobdellovibrionaceae bacterium]